MSAARSVTQLKVTLDQVEPAVLRRLGVPPRLNLDRLHRTLQAALGWADYHLWAFHVQGVSWGVPASDGWDDDLLDAGKTTVFDVLEDTLAKTLRYLYDFGDGWEHVIKAEKIKPALEPMSARRYRWSLRLCRRPRGPRQS